MARKRRKGKKPQSYIMNNNQYKMYYEIIQQMCCSLYRWQNMPPEIDQRFLELTLFGRGLSVFFHDEEYDAFFACEASPSGQINMYQNPLQYIAYGANGFRRTLRSADCVPIWNNYLRRPNTNMVHIYARRLADIDRTIDVNLMAQKTPIVAIVPESQRLSVENAMKQYAGNEPIIIGADGMFDPQSVNYLAPNAPMIVNDLLKAKFTIWGELMTFLGIDNTNVSKAERVQSAEILANNGQIETCRLIQLDCRRFACKEINRKYGLDVWCDVNRDISSENYYAIMTVPSDDGGSPTNVSGGVLGGDNKNPLS